MRELLDDPRVATPILANYPILDYDDAFKVAISRQQFSKEILEQLFDDPNKQELNLGNENASPDTVKFYIKHAPEGSRFIFYKPVDFDKFINDHIEWTKEFEHNKYIMKKRNWGVPTFDKTSMIRRISDNLRKLENNADMVNAGPWKEFNVGDYFQDGSDIPTGLLVREYIKKKNDDN